MQLADPGEGNQGVRLLEYWRIVYKYKWLILAIVAISLAGGVATTLLTPKVYTASTTLEIDREASNVVGMGDVEPMDKLSRDQEFFQTQYGLLKSFSLAARVAQSENLANDPAFLQALGVRHPRSGPKAADGSWVAGFLEGGLGVYPVRDSRLVRLTFDSPNPALSARIANAFADNFISSNLERRFEASAYARNFLEQRLAGAEGQAGGSRAPTRRLRDPAADHPDQPARRRQGCAAGRSRSTRPIWAGRTRR